MPETGAQDSPQEEDCRMAFACGGPVETAPQQVLCQAFDWSSCGYPSGFVGGDDEKGSRV